MTIIGPDSQAAKVLIVERQHMIREALQGKRGAAARLDLAAPVSGVCGAIAWLKANPVDVLLTDLRLSDGSGLDVIRACNALQTDCDIMVVTQSFDQAEVFSCIDAGADGYVLRDERCQLWSDLGRTVGMLRGGGAPLSPMVAREVLSRARRATAPPAAPAPPPATELLTRRETAILGLIANGNTYEDVARALCIALGTVQNHIKNIYSKLAVHSRTKAVLEGRRLGLLPQEAPAGSLLRLH